VAVRGAETRLAGDDQHLPELDRDPDSSEETDFEVAQPQHFSGH